MLQQNHLKCTPTTYYSYSIKNSTPFYSLFISSFLISYSNCISSKPPPVPADYIVPFVAMNKSVKTSVGTLIIATFLKNTSDNMIHINFFTMGEQPLDLVVCCQNHKRMACIQCTLIGNALHWFL